MDHRKPQTTDMGRSAKPAGAEKPSWFYQGWRQEATPGAVAQPMVRSLIGCPPTDACILEKMTRWALRAGEKSGASEQPIFVIANKIRVLPTWTPCHTAPLARGYRAAEYWVGARGFRGQPEFWFYR